MNHKDSSDDPEFYHDPNIVDMPTPRPVKTMQTETERHSYPHLYGAYRARTKSLIDALERVLPPYEKGESWEIRSARITLDICKADM